MQEKEITPQPQAVKEAFTPHELYNYHIAHPNEPITDEDIRNLRIDSGSVSKEHQVGEAVFVPPYDDDNIDKPIAENDTASTNSIEERPKTSPYDLVDISK